MSEKIICYCKNTSENSILNAIKQGASSLKEIQDMTTACTGNQCKKLNPKKRCCSIEIMELLSKKNSDAKDNCCNCNCC